MFMSGNAICTICFTVMPVNANDLHHLGILLQQELFYSSSHLSALGYL